MILLILCLFLIFTQPVMAQELIITDFYQAKNIYPGFNGQNSLKITNPKNIDCPLSLRLEPLSSNYLSDQINLSIIGRHQVLYGGSFNQLHHQSTFLTTLKAKESLDLLWQFSFPRQADNLFQNSHYQSDIIFNFDCNQFSPSSTGCHQSIPRYTPIITKVVPGINSVTLFWTEPNDTFTYYLIAYSQEAHAATFANPNIGPPGTTSYTINNLDAGVKYFFKIKVGNGCATGSFSEIVSATPLGEATFSTPASGFLNSSVLGLSTIPDYFPEDQSTSEDKKCLSIIPFTFLLALIVNLFFIKKPAFIFLSSLLALAIDYYLSRFICTPTSYIIFTPIISFIIPFLLSFKIR